MKDSQEICPPGLSVCRQFHSYLRKIQRRNFEGRLFYPPPYITAWLQEKAPSSSSSNVERLIQEVYADEQTPFPPQVEEEYFPLFSILLHEEIQCGHMFHIFRKELSRKYHLGLEDMSKYYQRIVSELETSRLRVPSTCGLSSYSEVIAAFDRIRWHIVTVRLTLKMEFTVAHASGVLPFCYRKVINDKGGTASVCLYGIERDFVEDPDLREALEPSKQENSQHGTCYELAVKSFSKSMKEIYGIENEAFRGLQNVQGVVQYLGEYKTQHPTTDCPDAPSNHIMLEYGEMDLDEYLADTYPPVLNGEIRDFWDELFSVARTLERIQDLDRVSSDGKRQKYRGWHGDVKPDNILRVRGKYKLADFGFAKFERREKEKSKTILLGGTRTYGAPECDSSRGATPTPLSQTIDTWSLGCVLSSVATWLVLGSQAYENYSERRKIAITSLKAEAINNTMISVPCCDDAFHDGSKVLSAVTEWHDYLRNSARKADTTTHQVLDLVDNHMLLPSPEDRLMMGELCQRLDEIILLSEKEYQHNLDEDLLRKIGPGTLSALRELDNQAPMKAVTAYGAGAGAGAEMDTSGGGLSPAGTVVEKIQRSERVRKSERFDKIVFAKTANRVQSCHSIPSLRFSENPLQFAEATGFDSNRWVRHQQAEIPDIRLHSSDSPPADNVGPSE